MSDIVQMQRAAQALRPLLLPASRAFAISYGGLFSILILLGIFALPFNPFLALGYILFFLALFSLIVVTMRPGATYLALDSDGITRCLFFRTKTVRWAEITKIRAGWFGYESFEIPWHRQVMTHYRRDDRDDVLSFFPYQFGMNSEQAIRLLTPYFENAHRKSVLPQDEAAAA
jgi:hypothetical protein